MVHDILADPRQRVAHLRQLIVAQPGERLKRHRLGEFGKPRMDWLRLGGQRQSPRTAVGRIALALDQSGLGQPIDDSAGADRLDIEPVGQLDLLHPRMVTKDRDHPPLRASDPKLSRPPIIEAPHRMRCLANFPRKFFHNSPYNKRAY